MPPHVWEGLYTSILHGLSTGVKPEVFLQCLTIVTAGNGLSRPGGNLGFRVQGSGFRALKGLWLGIYGDVCMCVITYVDAASGV